MGVTEQQIGVISPYSAQVSEVRRQFKVNNTKIEVSTVDGFQGREKEIIIITMVRSNPRGEIGFLSNEKRMNVAVTRAKRLCVLIGDSGTVGKNKFLKSLVDYFKANGQCRSGFDYLGNDEVRQGYGHKGKEQTEKKDKKVKQSQKKDQSQKDQSEYKPLVLETPADKRRKEELYDQLVKFKHQSSEATLSLPGLNSFERQIVHELADALGLKHESKGEGKSRTITVTKPIVKMPKTPLTQSVNEETKE